jgi:hypothetical protein
VNAVPVNAGGDTKSLPLERESMNTETVTPEALEKTLDILRLERSILADQLREAEQAVKASEISAAVTLLRALIWRIELLLHAGEGGPESFAASHQQDLHNEILELRSWLDRRNKARWRMLWAYEQLGSLHQDKLLQGASWPELVTIYCDCGREHTEACVTRLKESLREIEAVAKRFGQQAA